MKKFLFVFSIFWLFLNFNLEVFPQATERSKPKIKKFGSSLNRKPEENSASRKAKKNKDSDEEIIRIDTNLVVTDFLVLDKKGKAIYGLKKDDFIVSEGDEPEEIQTFTLGDDVAVPRSIVLIIDYSGSQLPYIERSVEAAKLLVDKLRPNDLMAVVTDDVELIAQFTSNKEELKKKLDSLKRHTLSGNFGKSRQFSALYAVLNEMFDEEDVRPIILFQTDGDELNFLKGGVSQILGSQSRLPSSEKANFSFNDLVQKAEKTRATIYTIVPGVDLIGLSEEQRRVKLNIEYEKIFGRSLPSTPAKLPPAVIEKIKKNQELIKKHYPNGVPDPQEEMMGLSKLTGGWIDFLETPEEANKIYSRILSEINLRYIIGYSPKNDAKDGKRRMIKISVKNHPDYIIWGRKSYIPVSDEQ